MAELVGLRPVWRPPPIAR